MREHVDTGFPDQGLTLSVCKGPAGTASQGTSQGAVWLHGPLIMPAVGLGGGRSFCVKTHPILQGRHTTKFYRYSYFTYFKIIFTYLYFWLPWVFLTAHGNSSVATSTGYFSWWCPGFSLRWFFLWSTGSRAWAQQLWHTGLTAPRHGVFPDQG